MTEENFVTIALADDHVLLRNALGELINTFDGFKVVCLASNGLELLEFVSKSQPPDIVLLDLSMPGKDGYETALWFKENLPQVHVLMLTMYNTEATLIRLLQAGVKGFLKKDVHPAELRFALQSLKQSGYYYSHNTTGKLVNLFRNNNENEIQKKILSEQEINFLKMAASDMTYKEIAVELALNPRAVDNMRDHLFEKLDVKSRVGLAMFAIRHGLVGL